MEKQILISEMYDARDLLIVAHYYYYVNFSIHKKKYYLH